MTEELIVKAIKSEYVVFELNKPFDSKVHHASEKTGDGRGVRNVKPPCTEGKITWISPYGAVRIEFNPGFPDFEACFIVEASNLRAQVSQETFGNSNSALAENVSLQPLITANGRTEEHCVYSKSLPIILFIEPERTTESKGLNKIQLKPDELVCTC
ncbi:hypothetical protein KUTeg_004436 [Tegillarca granosa]|uniref:Uncharacterized protein n=1 Tax=Tegillarca granosa TaxID=220873 RepID=A0ABQ9FSU0_TEGGR|nr:hypothetical protein KUTeg_004436 [Tegillarca granosa]